MTFNGGPAGNPIAIVGFSSFVVTDSATGTSIVFADSGAVAYQAKFDVTLDLASNGVTFNGASSFGANSLTVTADRTVLVSAGAAVATSTGGITLDGNFTAGAAPGANFIGVSVTGTVTSTGTGPLTVRGKGGNSGFDNFGVFADAGGQINGGTGPVTVQGTGGSGDGENDGVRLIGALVTSGGGAVLVTGQGGTSSGPMSLANRGVLLQSNATVTAGGGGTVTVQGTGGAGGFSSAIGVDINVGTVTSGGGPVLVTGQGGAAAGVSNYGVTVSSGAGVVTAGGIGTVTVQGTGGTVGVNNLGVFVVNGGRITSGGGAVDVTGTAGSAGDPAVRVFFNGLIGSGGGAAVTVTGDSMDLLTTTSIDAGGGVATLRPLTAGTKIDLGGADAAGTLGLAAAELDRVTAGRLVIGGAANTGAVFVTAALAPANAPNVDLVTATDIRIKAAVSPTGDFTAEAGVILTSLVGAPITVAAGKALSLTVGTTGADGFMQFDGDLIAPGGATLAGGTGNDIINVRPYSAALAVSGKGGNDTLTVILSAADLKANITYDGGAGGDDALRVSGGGTQTATILLTPSAGDPGQGKVTVGAGTVVFSGLEPVDVIGVAVAKVYFAGTDDVVSVAPGILSTSSEDALVVSGTTGGLAFESVHLRANTSVVIDTRTPDGVDFVTTEGTDAVTVNGITGSDVNTDLTVVAGSKAGDKITVAAAVALAGDFSLSASAVAANADIQAGGNVALTTGPDADDAGNVQNVTIAAGVDVTSTGGDVTLSAADWLVATGAGTIQAAGQVVMAVDKGSAETAAAAKGGKAFLVLGDIVAPGGAALFGGGFADEFTVTKYTAKLDIDGAAPVTSPGDKVCLNGGPGKVPVTVNGTSDAQFIGGGKITFTSIEEICLEVPSIVVNGTAGDDTLFLASNGGNPYYTLNGGTKTFIGTDVTDFTFNAGAGKDTLITELTLAADDLSTIADQVTYNGEADADKLAVQGTKQTADLDLAPVAGNLGRGTVFVGGGVLLFNNLEPVDMTGFGVVNVTLGGGTDDDVTIAAGALFGNAALKAIVVSGTTDGLAFESTAFRDVGRIVLNTLPSAGNDKVNVTGTGDKADHLNQTLEIVTGAGTDAVTVTGDVSLSGDLLITSGAVTTTAGKAIDVGGSVVLDADGSVSSAAAVTAGADVTFTAGVDVTNAGAVLAPSGAVSFNAAGTVTNSAAVTAGTTVTFTAGTAVNNKAGGAVTAADVTFTGPTVTNADAVTAGGTVTFAGDSAVANNAGGSVAAGTTVSFTATTGSVNNEAPVAAGTAVTFTAGNEITNKAGGVVTAGTTVTFAATNRVSNEDTVTGAGDVKFTSAQASVINLAAAFSTGGAVTLTAKTDISSATVAAEKAVTFTSATGTVAGTSTTSNTSTVTFTAQVDVNSADATAQTALTFNALGGSIFSTGATKSNTASVLFQAGTDIFNTGSITAAQGVTLIAGRDITNFGPVTATAGAVAFAAKTGKVDNVGPVTAGKQVTFTGGTRVINFAGGVISAGTDVIFSSSTNTENVDTVTAKTGSVTFTSKGFVVNFKAVTAAKSVAFTAATGKAHNVGSVTAGESVTITAGTSAINFVGGVISAGTDVVFSGATLTENQDAVNAKTGSVTFISTKGDVRNFAGVTAANNVAFTGDLDIQNTGTVKATAGTVSFTGTAGFVNNSAGVTAGTDVTFVGETGVFNEAGGTISAARDVLFSGAAVVSNQAAVGAGRNVAFVSANGPVNNSAVVTAGLDIKFVAGTFVLNNNVGTLSAGQDVIFQATGDVTNKGLGTVTAGRDIVFAAGGNVTSEQSVSAVRNLTFTAGKAVTLAAGKTFEAKTGTVTATAGTNLAAFGTVLKAANGTIVLAVDTDGAADPSGGTADIRSAQLVTKAGTTATLDGNVDNDLISIDAGYSSLLRIDGQGGFDLMNVASGNTVSISSCSVKSPTTQFASFFNVETVILNNAKDVTVLGDDPCPTTTPRADRVTLAKTAATYQITANGQSISAPLLAKFTFKGGALDDCLILDATLIGTPVFAAGIASDGGSGKDAVSLIGTGAETVTFTPTKTAFQAVLTVAGKGTVAVTNTEGVDLRNVLSATATYPNANDTLTLVGGKDFCLGNQALLVSGISGGVIVPTLAASKVTNLLVDTTTVDGTDVVTVGAASNAHLVTNLELRTGAGADKATFIGPLSVAGKFTATTGTIAVNTGGSIAAGGDVKLTAVDAAGGGQNIIVATGSAIRSNAGSITLSAGDDLLAGGAVLRAAGTIAIAVDAGNADPGTGAKLDLVAAVITAPTVTVVGNADADTFLVSGYTSPVSIDGKDPVTAPGDTLVFDAQNKPLTATANSFATAGAPVSYVNIETVQVVNATQAPLTVNGGDGTDDVLTITRDGSSFVYQFKGLAPVSLLGFPTAFRFNGLAGKDALYVVYAGGDPVPGGGATFDGGAGDDAGLCLIGTGGQSAAYLSSTAGPGLAGTVTVDGRTVSFLDLDAASQVDLVGLLAATVGFGTADDTVTIDSLDVCTDPVTGVPVPGLVASGLGFAKVGLANNGSVTLDTTGVDGNDSVTIAKALAHGNKSLTITTGLGNDTVAVNGTTSVDQDLTITSQDVVIRANTTAVAGNVTIANGKTLTLVGDVGVTAGNAITQAGGNPVAVSQGTATLTAGAGGVSLSGTVDGPGGLVVNTAGATTFAKAVGAGVPLAALITDAGGTTTVSGGLVSTVGTQAFNDPVTFTVGTTFQTTGGNVTFAGALTPSVAGLDLTFKAPGGDVSVPFDLAALGALTILDARNAAFGQSVTAASLTQLAGTGATTTGGAVTLSGAKGMSVTTQSLTIGGPLVTSDPTADVTLNVTGNVTFGGSVATRNLTQTNGAGITTFKGPVTLTGGADITTGTLAAGADFLAPAGDVTFATAGDATFAGTVKAVNLVQTGGAGTTTFNGPVTLTGGASLTTKNVTATSTFQAAGIVSLTATGDVSFGSTLTAKAVEQKNGAGTTVFAGPVTLDSTLVNSNVAAELTTGFVSFNAPFNAPNGNVVVRTTKGADQKAAVLTPDCTEVEPGGRITTPQLYLFGSGDFALDRALNETLANNGRAAADFIGELFAALSSGSVRYRDKADLAIRFADPAAPAAAITVGGNGTVELTTGTGFDLTDGTNQFQVPLIDVGGGTVTVFVGVCGPTTVRVVGEVKAAGMTVGVTDPADPRANKGADTFVIRPSQFTPLTINGNAPFRTDAGFTTGDALVPQFGGIPSVSLQATGDDGTYTFPGSPFQPLAFTSIESLTGITLDLFVVQTAPRAGLEDQKQFALRQIARQAGSLLFGGFLGFGSASNPFVVSPQQEDPNRPFSGPRVASADVDGDGVPDVIIANGPNDQAVVTVVSGDKLIRQGTALLSLNVDTLLAQGALIAQFFAYESEFSGGLDVAAADLNGDGKAEIITGPGLGGGQRVRVFRMTDAANKFANFTQYNGEDLGNGVAYPLLTQKSGSFFAFDENPAFRGGVNVAFGDVDGDGTVDVVVGAGVGGGPRVQAYSGKTGATIRDFFAYDPAFRGGVFVDAGAFNADPADDIATAPGPGGGPHVRVWDGSAVRLGHVGPPTELLANFFAFDPAPVLVSGEVNRQNGVADVAFGSSSDQSGRNRTVLVSTPRGEKIQILQFAPAATPGGVALQGNLLDTLDPNTKIAIFRDPNSPQFIGANPDLLSDGGSVGGFSSVTGT